MKKFLSIIILSFCLAEMSAQSLERSVIGSTGGSHSTATGSIHFTFGESSIHTLMSNNLKLTQGFQQPSSFSIIIEGDLSFDMNSPEGTTLACGEDLPYLEPIVISTCPGGYQLNFNDTIGAVTCNQVYTRTWHATDNCGNSATWVQTFIKTDTVDPVYVGQGPTEYFLECGQQLPSTSAFSDSCDESLDISSSVEVVDGVTYITWTAADDCGNTGSVVFTVHMSCCESPVLTSELPMLFLECGSPAFVPETPEFIDLNNEDITITYALDTVWVTCGFELHHIWTATNECGLSTEATQVAIASDHTAPVFTSVFSDVVLSCSEEIPAPVNAFATDNCDNTVLIEVEVSIIGEDECGGSVTQVNYTATDDCGNHASAHYTITVEDTEEPSFTSCPADLVVACGNIPPSAPAVEATDNCDADVDVILEEYYIGNAPVAGAVQQCSLLTPVRPANNPCGYASDWAMAFFGLPKAHRYYYVSQGSFVKMADGTIHLTATMNNVFTPGSGWTMNVVFANEMNWQQWSTQSTPHSFKGDCGGEGANHNSWYYYILQNTPGAELTGFGGYAGSSLNVKHSPSNNYFGFQLGDGANNYNGVENGFGGWFSYTGLFKVNGVNYGATGNITGGGDLAFELNCCPDYEMVRQWTAIDCSGNSTTCLQQIHIGESISGVHPQNMPSISGDVSAAGVALKISANPNPANELVTFTFNTVESDRTSLEIISLTGQKVDVIYNAFTESDMRMVMEYDTRALAPGVYFYNLVNGSEVVSGRLVIAH